MEKNKIAIDKLGNLITSDDILGKEVIDNVGEFLGIAETVYINPENLDIVGISIDKGFLKKGLIIGKDYIKNVTPYAIFLKIRPSYNIKGMSIFDVEGKKVGIVKKIVLFETKNQITKLVTNLGFTRKETVIDAGFIKNIGYNVLLNVKKKDLLTRN